MVIISCLSSVNPIGVTLCLLHCDKNAMSDLVCSQHFNMKCNNVKLNCVFEVEILIE